MAGCFDPGFHVFEYQLSGDCCRGLLHSTCCVNQSIRFEKRQAYRQRCKTSNGSTRSALASVSASIYGVESASPSLLSIRDLLLQLPVTARRFIAGAVAGAVSKLATGPIEAVRVQAMTTGQPLLTVVRQTFARGGLAGFFAGVEADILRTGPSKAIELAAFDLYKRILGQHNSLTGEWRAPGPLGLSIAGALAGVTSTLMVAPLDTLRTRMAHHSHQYRHIVDALQQTVADGGAVALYRGLGASLIGVIPYAAVRLSMYDLLKRSYQRVTGDSPPPQALALFGAVSAVASTSATFPLEVVRRRAMVGMCYPNTFTALHSIAASEGLGALYNGIVLTWVKQAPQYALQMMVYDILKQSLFIDNGRAERPSPARP